MQRIIGLVQARMRSSRLPGKAMLDLAGRPMIWHIFDRLRRVPELDDVVLATTTDRSNDAMVSFAAEHGVTVYRQAEEDDIAARLAGAVEATTADAILKVNGDCPLLDPEVARQIVRRFMDTPNTDYASNKSAWTYPKGLSVEVISRHAVLWCHENLTGPRDREFVADWIREHGDRFEIASVENGRDLSHHDWFVDTADDYAFVKDIFDELYRDGPCFGMEDVLAHLNSQHPESR